MFTACPVLFSDLPIGVLVAVSEIGQKQMSRSQRPRETLEARLGAHRPSLRPFWLMDLHQKRTNPVLAQSRALERDGFSQSCPTAVLW